MANKTFKLIKDYEEKDYSNFWSEKFKWNFNKQEKKILNEYLSDKKGWFIDIGCGSGRMIPVYKNKKEKIVLVDYSIKNLQRIRDNFTDVNMLLIAADILDMPFKKNIFSSSIAIRVMQNLLKPERFFSECSRIMQYKGEMVFSYFNKRNLLRLLRYGLKNLNQKHTVDFKGDFGIMCGTHPAFFKKLLKKYDFKSVCNTGAGFSYQIIRPVKLFQEMVEKYFFVNKVIYIISLITDSILGKFNLSLWQFHKLIYVPSNMNLNSNRNESNCLVDILQCPGCHYESLIENKDEYYCPKCKRAYPLIDGILDFRV